MTKRVVITVFDKGDGMYKYDSEVMVCDDEVFSVKVLPPDNLEIIQDDDEDVMIQSDIQGFSGEVTRVKGFQFNEPAEQKEKPKKKKTKKGE